MGRRVSKHEGLRWEAAESDPGSARIPVRPGHSQAVAPGQTSPAAQGRRIQAGSGAWSPPAARDSVSVVAAASRGSSLVVAYRLLIAMASFVEEHGF